MRMAPEGPQTPHMMVRGVSLISLYEYLKTRLDEKQLERFFDLLSPRESLTILSAKKWQWYPFGVQQELRTAIANWFNPQNPRDAVFDAGLFAAVYETSTFLRAILAYLPVRQILKNSQVIWNKYYKPGRLSGKHLSQGHARFELSRFPADAAFCPMITSWLVIAAQTMNLDKARVEETRCVHRGGNSCRWELHWKP